MNTKIPSYFRLAKNVSKMSSHNYKMGACIIKSGNVISVGFNQVKSHPLAPRNGLHAEFHAIHNSDTKDLKGAKIFVYRENKKTKLPAMARPCEFCMEELKKQGFKWMYYSTNEYPFWECEKIK